MYLVDFNFFKEGCITTWAVMTVQTRAGLGMGWRWRGHRKTPGAERVGGGRRTVLALSSRIWEIRAHCHLPGDQFGNLEGILNSNAFPAFSFSLSAYLWRHLSMPWIVTLPTRSCTVLCQVTVILYAGCAVFPYAYRMVGGSFVEYILSNWMCCIVKK